MKNALILQSRWRIPISLFAITLLCLVHMLGTATPTWAAFAHSGVTPLKFQGQSYNFIQSSTQPPTDKQCRQQIGVPCYSPQEIRQAYGVDELLGRGFDGKGQTIVIIDAIGSPTILSDLQTFDRAFGLPDPPSFKESTPLGTKPFNPKNGTMISWAAETTLDVEWAHVIAPGANIVLMTSPTAETQGVQGMPQFLYLEQYALDHNLGRIISQSWATTENTLFYPGGKQVLASFNNFYKQAAARKVTILASSGDTGVANPDSKGKVYSFPTVNFPASSPYVTAVGGTSLMASTQGDYQSETAWSGSGGGVSQYWSEPDYQVNNLNQSDQKLLNGHRGLPDISYNADPNTPILVYLSFVPGQVGYYLFGGTSEGAPQWAGLIADANQLAGHPLGFLNPALYKISNNGTYYDVTKGNNSAGGLQGYNATPGWDPVTGWGSPKAATLAMELAKMQ